MIWIALKTERLLHQKSYEAGIVKQIENGGIKVLGGGKITKKLTVKANKFSASAEAAIVKAGGQVEAI